MSKPKRKEHFALQAKEMKQSAQQLADEFGLSLVAESADVYGIRLTYQNSLSGVRFEFSPLEEPGWSGLIARLVDGQFPRYPIFIDRSTKLEQYDIRDAAAENIRFIPDLSVKLLNMEPLSADEVVEVVKRCCPDILRGDFSIFPKLDTRVKGRLPAEMQPK